MIACYKNHFDCIIWMLQNGSSMDENNILDIHGNIVSSSFSCKTALKNHEIYDDIKRIFSKKSSRK